MANHVFISHSHDDKTIAEMILHELERRGVRCWIAPRDVPAGGSYAEALLNAIEASSCFVLIFTASSNMSSHVLREVERALKFGVNIIPIRFDDSQVSKSLDYLLATVHWLSATSGPRHRAVSNAAQQIASVTASMGDVPRPMPPAREPVRPTVGSSARSFWIGLGSAALVALLFYAYTRLAPGTLGAKVSHGDVAQSTPLSPPPDPAPASHSAPAATAATPTPPSTTASAPPPVPTPNPAPVSNVPSTLSSSPVPAASAPVNASAPIGVPPADAAPMASTTPASNAPPAANPAPSSNSSAPLPVASSTAPPLPASNTSPAPADTPASNTAPAPSPPPATRPIPVAIAVTDDDPPPQPSPRTKIIPPSSGTDSSVGGAGRATHTAEKTASSHSTTKTAPTPAKQADPFLGTWKIANPMGLNTHVEVLANHRAHGTSKVLGIMQEIEGSWTLVAENGDGRHYQITWRNPTGIYIDSVLLDEDGRHYHGTNQLGWPISAERSAK